MTSAAQSRPARPCIIRLASTEDAPAIARIYRPVVEATAVSFETEPPDANEMHRRVAETLMAYPWLVLECDAEVVGFAYASRHRTRAAYRWSVDTSAYVDERFRRQGIGHGLYVSLFAILSAQGFANAYAGIALPNPASVALHEHVGFKAIGVFQSVGYKLGAWRDVGWWHRPLRSNDRPPPPEIQSLEEVKENSTWPALLTKGSTVVHVAKPLAAEA